jgi:hypothetical protein
VRREFIKSLRRKISECICAVLMLKVVNLL